LFDVGTEPLEHFHLLFGTELPEIIRDEINFCVSAKK
jgi:hypothetical protein